jgi:DNA-binding HxlR family transcriptional regulator
MNIIKIIAQPYVLEILEALKKPKRYRDLKPVCKNDRTLTKRINNLQELGLVESVALKEGNKYVNFYRLTNKGRNFLAKIEKLKL